MRELGLALLALLLVSSLGCGQRDNAVPKLQSAEAVSSHYVMLEFTSPPDEAALNPRHYEIVDAEGHELELKSVVRAGNGAVFITGQQRRIEYTITERALEEVQGDEAIKAKTAKLVNGVRFEGSTLGEASITDVYAVNNTEVLVVFDQRLGAEADNIAAYLIESPNLEVLSATINREDSAVLLRTSPQEGIEYRLRIDLGIAAQNHMLINPSGNEHTFMGRTVRDETAPQLVGAQATDNTTLLLTFSEPLADDAANPAFFSIAPELTVISTELTRYNTQMVIKTSPMLEGVTYTVAASDGVKDPARHSIDPAANSATFSSPAISDGTASPRVVGAVSTGNTAVLVRYSRPMNDAAIVASNYSIVQENVNSEAGAVGVRSARFADSSRLAVELTTYSQNEVTYRVSVSNVSDMVGNPLAPKVTSNGVLVDPTSAVFAGTPAGGTDIVDSDGDGLSDNVELRGWLVSVVLLDGTVSVREVTSNPGDPSLPQDHPVNVAARDTDGDLVDDAIERLLGSDPRQADTDGDILTDDEEYNATFSNQNMLDSDGDGIDDYLEVTFFKTNALIADSDGDGFTDDEELFERNRDPRIADLPRHEIEVGGVALRIDERFTYTDEEGVTRSESSSTEAAVQSASSTSRFTSNHLGVNFEGGIEPCSSDTICTVWDRVKLIAGVEYFHEWGNESATALEEAYAHSQEKASEFASASSVTREVVGASISVDVTLRNTSTVAISLADLELTIHTPSSADATKLVPVATLIPEAGVLGAEGGAYHIGPGESRGPIVFTNREVYPNLIEDLMRAPRGLVFKVANYNLETSDGRNFATGLQDVRERTVGIFVDPGNGDVAQYQAITAGVLERPADELRCARSGDHPNAVCTSNADCGTSTPCAGGQIIGGFAGFGGTGRPHGVPVDYLLQEVIGMKRSELGTITPGPDGILDSVVIAGSDDVTTVDVDGRPVIRPGLNLRLETQVSGDDELNNTPDGILAGPDRVVDTYAYGDDVQLIPAGTIGVPEDAVAISAGENGVIDSLIANDDVADVVTGFEVASTCGANTVPSVLPGPNGIVDTTANDDAPVNDDVYLGPGVPCSTDYDCSLGGNGTCTGPQKIVRVDNRRDGDYRRFWALMLSDDVEFKTDFGLMQVRPGDQLALKFVQDIDRDGLTADLELLAGSSDFSRDTDGDGLGDFTEVRIGWEVGVVGQPLRQVFSNPGRADSDRDGLTDLEESDFRPLYCGATPEQCGTVDRFRTDPRNRDTDQDSVSDFDEVFGFLTGAGIVDIGSSPVILAGDDLTADTVACPQNYCEGTGEHCAHDGDCQDRNCVQPVPCDDVQVVPVGTGVTSPNTIVVAPGPLGFRDGQLATPADGSDELVSGGDNLNSTRSVGDDVPIVALSGQPNSDVGGLHCVDGSRLHASGLPTRFALCSVVKPGVNGRIDTLPSGDDALVPEGYGQRREITDPLNADTDQDQIRDGYERMLGSSPTDSGDTGLAGDLDKDGLTDSVERSGWSVAVNGVIRQVNSNPNVADTDLDGLPDYAELHMPCFDDNTSECPTDPTTPDSDGDGISDLDEMSPETLAYLKNFENFFLGYELDEAASREYGTNPLAPDTDGDGLSDDAELFGSRVVKLNDGTSRTVTSDPRLADTDADGLNDGQEQAERTDPRDPDTDDDGRVDGEETGSFDPLVPDLRATINFRRIEIDDIPNDGIDGDAEFLWWFLVSSSTTSGKTLVSDADDAPHGDDDPFNVTTFDGIDTCLAVELSGGNNHHTIQLERTHSVVLTEDDHFVAEGFLGELDSASDDCGTSPHYVPSSFNSECYTRFNKVFSYDDLVNTARGQVVEVDPADVGATGKDRDDCDWSVVMTIRVD